MATVQTLAQEAAEYIVEQYGKAYCLFPEYEQQSILNETIDMFVAEENIRRWRSRNNIYRNW